MKRNNKLALIALSLIALGSTRYWRRITGDMVMECSNGAVPQ